VERDFFVAVKVVGSGDNKFLRVDEEEPAGAVIWRFNATVATRAETVSLSAQEIDALEPGAQKRFRRYCWQDGDDGWCGCKGIDPTLDRINFLQHSCDPCLWFDGADDNCLIARHDLKRVDNLNIEYATCDASSTIDLGCECACADVQTVCHLGGLEAAGHSPPVSRAHARVSGGSMGGARRSGLTMRHFFHPYRAFLPACVSFSLLHPRSDRREFIQKGFQPQSCRLIDSRAQLEREWHLKSATSATLRSS
jgi:hypothetical protein